MPDRAGRPDASPAPARPTPEEEAWAPPPREPRGAAGPDLGLAGYEDVVEIARGGDSVVYRARQVALRRDVAIKVIDVADPATLARFRRELEITVTLGRQHPHIVTVLDTATTPDGRACLVMDFHDLGSLHERVRAHGPLPASEVVAAGTAVADALAFAHGHGVLHRDVKPQNVLVLPTSYVLTDFGIARRADSGRTASLERFSYRHASPQVLDGLEPTAADDLWSLGSTLSTLVHGRAPFSSDDEHDDTALGYLRRVRMGQRRPQERDGVPAELVAVIERCLQPDRDARFPDAAAVRDALAAVPTESRSWAPGAVGPAAPPASAPATTATPDAPSAPAPAPAARPVAPSALAAADTASSRDATPPATARGERDADATGMLTPAPRTDDGAPAGADDDGAPAARRRWPAMLGFAAGAVLVGSAIGVGAVMLTSRGGDAPGPTAPPATAAPIAPADPAEPPSDAADPLDVDLSDPAVAPAGLVLVDNGTSITASWTDPTGGGIQVAVVDVTDPADPLPLESIQAGVTERTVEGVDPDAPTVCLQLVGIDVTDPTRFGASSVECVHR